MSIFTLFRRSARQQPKPNPRRTHTPHLEVLEDRALPSAALPLPAGTIAAITPLVAPDPSITFVNGSGQSYFAGYSFQPLQARVTENGQGVAGIPVTFTAPAGGASGFFGLLAPSATVLTDVNGWATAPVFTANGAVGSYTVTASSSAATGLGTFSLTNIPPNLTFPFGPPTLVQWQLDFDLQQLPSINTAQGKSDLSNQFGAWFAFAYLQSPQQAVQLFWNEISLMQNFLFRDGGSFYNLDRDPATVDQALNLIANPLYNTLAGYGMGLVESELILVSAI